MEKYDRDFDERDMQLYQKRKEIEELCQKQEELQTLLLNRQNEIFEWISYKKSVRLQEIFLRSQNRAAVIIQVRF